MEILENAIASYSTIGWLILIGSIWFVTIGLGVFLLQSHLKEVLSGSKDLSKEGV